MKSRFHEELKEIKKDVLAMGELARKILKNSVNALLNKTTSWQMKYYRTKKK